MLFEDSVEELGPDSQRVAGSEGGGTRGVVGGLRRAGGQRELGGLGPRAELDLLGLGLAAENLEHLQQHRGGVLVAVDRRQEPRHVHPRARVAEHRLGQLAGLGLGRIELERPLQRFESGLVVAHAADPEGGEPPVEHRAFAVGRQLDVVGQHRVELLERPQRFEDRDVFCKDIARRPKLGEQRFPGRLGRAGLSHPAAEQLGVAERVDATLTRIAFVPRAPRHHLGELGPTLVLLVQRLEPLERLGSVAGSVDQAHVGRDGLFVVGGRLGELGHLREREILLRLVGLELRELLEHLDQALVVTLFAMDRGERARRPELRFGQRALRREGARERGLRALLVAGDVEELAGVDSDARACRRIFDRRRDPDQRARGVEWVVEGKRDLTKLGANLVVARVEQQRALEGLERATEIRDRILAQGAEALQHVAALGAARGLEGELEVAHFLEGEAGRGVGERECRACLDGLVGEQKRAELTGHFVRGVLFEERFGERQRALRALQLADEECQELLAELVLATHVFVGDAREQLLEGAGELG